MKNLFFLTYLFPLLLQAQDGGLLGELEQTKPKEITYAVSTFKGTRLVSAHSCENVGHNQLVFIIGHRFGRVNQGAKELFGLDQATMRMGFEYGFRKEVSVGKNGYKYPIDITLGLGRSSWEKTFDGFIKWRILQQSKKGEKTFMPLTISLFANTAIKSGPFANPANDYKFHHRISYAFKLIFARKFHEYFSMQVSPVLVHRNLVLAANDKNDVFAIEAGARVKITRSLSFNAEYFYVIPGQISSPLYGEKVRNAVSVGFDLETGGHVFQLHFTNSRFMIENGLASATTGNIAKGDIQFGFNMTRNFALQKGAYKKKR